ncbi:MAG: hypothetical protein E7158_06810 [Firmicutes bacterium]|nr:hypothetical protein [Bacillota bacterium]
MKISNRIKKKLSLKDYTSAIYVKNILILNKQKVLTKDTERNQYESSLLFKDYLIIGENIYNNSIDDNNLIELFIDKDLPLGNPDLEHYKIDIILDRTKEFLINTYLLFSIDQKCKHIINQKEVSVSSFTALYKYLTNFNWTSYLLPYFESDKLSFDQVLSYFNNIDKIDTNVKDDISLFIRHGVLKYVSERYNESPINLQVIKDDNNNNNNNNNNKIYGNYGFFRTTNDISGLINYELLNYLLPNKLNSSFSSCKHCGSIFYKIGNRKYCDTCIGNDIPSKIKRDRYENSPKGKATRKKRIQRVFKKTKQN